MHPCYGKDVVELLSRNLACDEFESEYSFVTKNFQKLCFQNKILKKLQDYWPFQEEIIHKKILAWQRLDSAHQAVQHAFAFLIKCFVVLRFKDQEGVLDKRDLFFKNIQKKEFKYLFTASDFVYHSKVKILFWNEIKDYYQVNQKFVENKNRSQFVQFVLPKNAIVILCLEDTCFRLRSGSNQELSSFEFFLSDMLNFNNSLIAFSIQSLVEKRRSFYLKNFSVNFKLNFEKHEISLRKALEPEYHIAGDKRFVNAYRFGVFDRLLELLSKGQDFINSIEKDFLEWKLKIKN
jgi:hypothetical protein